MTASFELKEFPSKSLANEVVSMPIIVSPFASFKMSYLSPLKFMQM